LADEIIEEFLIEAGELLGLLERDLVSVDGGRDPMEVVAQTFRVFHTLKGTSAFLGFDHVRDLGHAAEDLLDAIRGGVVEWTPKTTDLLLESLDAFRAMVEEAGRTGSDGTERHEGLIVRLRAAATEGCDVCVKADCPLKTGAPCGDASCKAAPVVLARAAELEAAESKEDNSWLFEAKAAPPHPAPPAEPTAAPPAPLFQPRAPAPKLIKRAIRHPKPEAAAATPTPTPTATPAPPPVAPPAKARDGGEAGDAGGSLRVPITVLDRLMNLVGELVLARNQLLCHPSAREDARLAETSQRIDQLTAGLQESVMRSRMQPIDQVFSRLPRVVRDTAQAVGKQARLVVSGAETELDKTLLEAIKDPLTHVVRNAVDHGLEKPPARAAAGKPAEGTVAVRAFQDGGQVIVEVEDDGAGINVEKVKAKALALGLITAEEAARLSDRDAVELVFRPGFSTADAVTQISGRGVGMDVVRTNVERIGGSVEMVSRAGRGSSCRMRVPLTMVIVPALVVDSAGERYAIPQAALAELVRIPPDREAEMLADLQGTRVLRLRGTLLPVVDLAAQLGTGASRPGADGGRSVVVLTAQGRQFGLMVDEVADTEEIVVKPLGRQLQQLGVYSGATVRGDGRVALVLDVQGLARQAGLLGDAEARLAAREAAAGPGARRQTFLVLRGADDGRLAIPLAEVTRLEEIDAGDVESVGHGEALQYRGAILPLFRLGRLLPERRRHPRGPVVAPAVTPGRLQLVVQPHQGRDVGLVLMDQVLDVVEEAVTLDREGARPGVAGCAVIQGRITEVLDTAALLSRAGERLPEPAEVEHV